jgi:hypothetical protein
VKIASTSFLQENFYVLEKRFNFNNLLSMLRSGIEIAGFNIDALSPNACL